MIEYETPKGYRDTPFIYVFDPNPLTGTYPFVADAHNQLVYTGEVNQLAINLKYGEQFILRRVIASFLSVGPQLVSDPSGGIKLRNALNIDRSSNPRALTATALDILGYPLACSLPVGPELLYPVRGAIGFDLQGLKLRYNFQVPGTDPNTVPLSQLLFQGVRRFPISGPDNRLLQPGYQERMYYIPLTVNINWWYWQNGLAADGIAPFQRFNVQLTTGDFELLEIRTYNDNIGAGGCGGGTNPTVDLAKIMLYDYAGVAMMSAPVNLSAINSALSSGPHGGPFSSGGAAGAGAFCPPILYPNRSTIQVDVYSLLNKHDVSVGHNITIVFVGRRRSKA